MDKRLITVIMAAVLMALLITAIFYQVTVGRGPTQAEVSTREPVPDKIIADSIDSKIRGVLWQWAPLFGFSWTF